MSVTDTTVEDLETTVTEEAAEGDKDLDVEEEEGRKLQEEEIFPMMLQNQTQTGSAFQDENPLDGNQGQPGKPAQNLENKITPFSLDVQQQH